MAGINTVLVVFSGCTNMREEKERKENLSLLSWSHLSYGIESFCGDKLPLFVFLVGSMPLVRSNLVILYENMKAVTTLKLGGKKKESRAF